MTQDAGTEETLIVLGGGPKAVAIGTKLHVLRKLGWQVPRLRVIEQHNIAAAWTGEGGYTDGEPLLGTSPIKDLGYPYASLCLGDSQQCAAVNRLMLQYSWHAYLIEKERLWNWVDRGSPVPTHADWAAYLKWAASKCGLQIDRSKALSIRSSAGECWTVEVTEGGKRRTIDGHGLVITGSGVPIKVEGQPLQPINRFSDGQTFWQKTEDLRALGDGITIGVLGMGGTAAGIVLRLLELTRDRTSVAITMIGPSGGMYTRGEGFDEVRMFSVPDNDWGLKSEDQREEYIRRTDEGVFSEETRRTVDRSDRIKKEHGKATRIEILGDNRIAVQVEHLNTVEMHVFDYVVNAVGFDRFWFWDLMDKKTRRTILGNAHKLTPRDRVRLRAKSTRDRYHKRLERSIDHDLSVSKALPRLHLPMLAGIEQGPGFPGLRSLGMLSDRILQSYISSPSSITTSHKLFSYSELSRKD